MKNFNQVNLYEKVGQWYHIIAYMVCGTMHYEKSSLDVISRIGLHVVAILRGPKVEMGAYGCDTTRLSACLGN